MIRGETPRNIIFPGNQGTITLVRGQRFFTYGLGGGVLDQGQLPLPKNHQLIGQWTHKEFLQFATSFEADGKPAINIQELQLTSSPLCSIVGSFHVPLIDGEISFSPVSLHASFITKGEVIILDIQGLKFLFHFKASQPLYDPPGQFSPDGSFLACQTLDHNICIWKNTPTGYVHWNTLQSKLLFCDFLFSPTSASVITWGQDGIQLLYPGSFTGPPSPSESKPLHQSRKHLVAYSSDGAYIVIAQQCGGVVKVLDSLPGTLVQSIHTDVQIQAIGIVDDTVFVVGGDRLTSWNIGVGEGPTVSGSHDITTVSAHMDGTSRSVSSNCCSWVVFVVGQAVILYDKTAHTVLAKFVMDGVDPNIQFSQDGCKLYVCSRGNRGWPFQPPSFHLIKFKRGDGCSVSVTAKLLEEYKLLERYFPPSPRYQFVQHNWIEDSSGCKYLWLPPHWRSWYGSDMELEGRFLALVGSHHQNPIIIELQPQPHLLPIHPQ